MRSLTVVDVGARTVLAVSAKRKKNGAWDIVGGGRAPIRGICRGEITHLGDAVEAFSEAIGGAQRSSGEKISSVYYNFNHASVCGTEVSGTKFLFGEGRITPADMQEAREAALRMVGSFERSLIYVKESGFLVDERDTVTNPLGIYGQRLDVTLYALTADAQTLDVWRTAMERCYLRGSRAVFSGEAMAYGILTPDQRKQKTVLVDLRQENPMALLFEANAIRDYTSLEPARVVERVGALAAKSEGVTEIVVTDEGKPQESVIRSLASATGLSVCVSGGATVGRWTDPSGGAAIGLLDVADELEKNRPVLFEGAGLLWRLGKRAASYWKEYF